MFLIAVPVAVIAFPLTWLLKEVPLRQTSRTTNPADTLAPTAVPAARSSLDEIGRSLSVLMGREGRIRMYERLASRAGLDLDPRSCWILLRLQEHPDDSLQEFAQHLSIPASSLAPLFDSLVERDLALSNKDLSGVTADTGPLRLTEQGRLNIDQLVVARRETPAEFVADWSPERHAELGDLLTRLAHELVRDPAPAD